MFDRGYIKSMARWRLQTERSNAILAALAALLCGASLSGGVQFRLQLNGSEESARFAAVFLPLFLILGLVSVVYSVFLGNVSHTGLRGWFMRYSRGENARAGEVFASFRIYLPSMTTALLRDVFVFLWSLLFIIPGIVMSYAYSMADYIIYENPNLSPSRALQMSKAMTQGHKGDLFIFDLSFFGWMLLSGLTCGILGIVYVNPYMYTAHAGLYDALKDNAIRQGILRWEDFGQLPPPPVEPPVPPYGYPQY